MLDIRDMLIHLFPMDKAEAEGRIYDKFHTLDLTDDLTSNVLGNDSVFDHAHGIYWSNPNWWLEPANALTPEPWPRSPGVDRKGGDTYLSSKDSTALHQMMVRLFGLSRDEADGRIASHYPATAPVDAGKRTTFQLANDIYWNNPEWWLATASELEPRAWS